MFVQLMFSKLMAKFYDKIMADAEKKCLGDWRRSLLQKLSGEVLELGCGTGANLAFYPKSVTHLVLTEPNPHMRKKLVEKLLHYPHLDTTILDYDGDSNIIPIPDNSFDAVVSTLVLCSVSNPQQILAELYRVLKPQGKLLFIEHIAAADHSNRFKWQKRLEPIWKTLFSGCHLTRSTEKNIIEAGFKIQGITRQSIRGVPSIARPCIRGSAIK